MGGRSDHYWQAIRMAALFLAAALGPVMSGSPAYAAPAEEERYYAISAQPLAQALTIFARESGVDIFFETELTRGLRSAPLQGRYSAAMALRALLADTGLDARFTDRRSAYVYSPSAAAETPTGMTSGRRAPGQPGAALQLDMAEVRAPRMIGKPRIPSYDAYAYHAVREIRSLLNSGGGLSGPNFSLVILVTIDRGGQITTVRLAPESRDREPERESEVRSRLLARQLSLPPPEGFEAPLRFEVMPLRTAKRN